jgi:hypothetical protein
MKPRQQLIAWTTRGTIHRAIPRSVGDNGEPLRRHRAFLGAGSIPRAAPVGGRRTPRVRKGFTEREGKRVEKGG